jgi:uncharacterized membrane protein
VIERSPGSGRGSGTADLPDGVVLARPAPRTTVRWARFREHVLSSIWFVPMCLALGAIVLSRLSIHIDEHLIEGGPPRLVLPGDTEALASAAGTVAAGMLTFLGVVLASTLIAVQLASSQFSPRIVRLFVRSPVTKVTIGLFLATFIFALNSLVGIRTSEGRVPAMTVTITYVLVMATVILFVVFLHSILRLLRAQHLIRQTASDAYSVFAREFPPAEVYVEAPGPDATLPTRTVSFAGDTGVLQTIDVGGLAALAERHDCWVEMLVAVGQHASPHRPLARIHGPDPSAVTDAEVLRSMLFGAERTLLQDPAFALRQLVDISSRALSPAINDPTTSVQALEAIIDLLARIADRPDPTGWYLGASGRPRVRLIDDSFERLTRLGFTEVLYYGRQAPQVTRRLVAAYHELAMLVDGPRREMMTRQLSQLHEVITGAGRGAYADIAAVADPMGLG